MDIFNIPVHPAAEVFPMLAEDELAELCADIQAHGLLQPLVVQEIEGVLTLIDGRNRLEACRRAGVDPHYNLLDGQDPVTYIISANINRRQLTRGQRIMIVANINNNFVAKLAHGEGKRIAVAVGVSEADLSKARTVLHHAPELSDHVLNGSLSLDKAYEEARTRKGQADTYESRFATLKAAAPDLADLVVDSQLALEEAEAAQRERLDKAHRINVGCAHALHELEKNAYLFQNEARRDQVVEFVLTQGKLYEKENAASIEELISAIEAFAEYAPIVVAEINRRRNAG